MTYSTLLFIIAALLLVAGIVIAPINIFAFFALFIATTCTAFYGVAKMFV